MTSGMPSVNSAPGIGPTSWARWVTQLPFSPSGLGTISRSTPSSTKYIDSVTTTGWTRRTAMSTPLSAPSAAPIASMIGIAS